MSRPGETVDWKALRDEVLARTDLAVRAGRYTNLKRKGREWSGLCPFHREKTPSFTVVPSKGFYHCFGCGAHGNAVDLLVGLEGMNFKDALAELAAEAGVEFPGADPGRVKRKRAPVAVAEAAPADDALARKKNRERAFRLWREGGPLDGSPAEAYLVEARAIPLKFVRGNPVLRAAARVDYWAVIAGRLSKIHTGPALLAAMQYADGKFAAVHITYLRPDGSGKLELYEAPGKKRPAKKVRGAPGGAAIRLSPPAARMAAGEGIETVLSVAPQGLPGWAAYSLDNLAGAGLGTGERDPRDKRKRLPSTVPDMGRPGMQMPPECRHVTYLGDGDTKDPLMLEAKLKRAAARALQTGIHADYAITPAGTDFNDLLRRDAAKKTEQGDGDG